MLVPKATPEVMDLSAPAPSVIFYACSCEMSRGKAQDEIEETWIGPHLNGHNWGSNKCNEWLWIFADKDIVPGVVADPIKEDLGEQVEKSESMKMIILYIFLCLYFC